ncbi:DUF1579 domain-containing protein [Panacibacter ginsenosidivorans]|uniref:DUF1579 domain-containing protein n=1 Tax=Panacibacter ginsenosidivorans TaxID=1813871 RepID=A0A5B8VCH6_9BACT|nr:heme-binding beta-barrel domain-containing protein [Panacibacter ginsenosidivorans]QEC69237.1 DUF1579 domain-containing protein [Panacibacter ginsenosidivorans]
MRSFLFILFSVPFISFSQTAKQDSIWKPLNTFIGQWKGTGEGEPGKGNYERSYMFILNNNFIEVRNKSSYPPTDKNPKGEVHQDIGYISYDQLRKLFILRQFHAEGFVNQYRLGSISADGKTIIFISEAIENINEGWRAKETYELKNENEFVETFELAPPNGQFEVYTKTVLQRKL